MDQSVDSDQLKSDISETPLEAFEDIESGMSRDAVAELVGTPTYLCGSGIAYEVYVLKDGHEVWIAYIEGVTAWASVSSSGQSEKRVLFGESSKK